MGGVKPKSLGSWLVEHPALLFVVVAALMMDVAHASEHVAFASFAFDFDVFWNAVRRPLAELYAPDPKAPFVYPPSSIPFFAPLKYFARGGAYLAWILLSFAALAASTRKAPPQVLALMLVTPMVVRCAFLGQNTMLLGSALIVAAMRGGVAGGLLLGTVACIKPQLVLMAPLVLLVRRDWRGLGGASAAAAFWLSASLLIYGLQPWKDWVGAFPSFHQVLVDRDLLWIIVSPAGTAERFGLPPVPFLLLGIAIAVLAVVRAAPKVQGFELAALSVMASVLAAPYATLQDLLAALPFLALALSNRRMDVIAVAAALILVTAFVLPGMLILMLAWISPQLIHKRKRPGHSARASLRDDRSSAPLEVQKAPRAP